MTTCFHALPVQARAAASGCDRLVAVHCTGGSNAALTYYKKDTCGIWTSQFTCNAFIGKAGPGKMREGDMKTPLGTFNLSTPFGIMENPSTDDPKKRCINNYLRINENHYWCGQSGPYYNRLIDNSTPPEGYIPSKADEHLIDYDLSYRYAMFIGYNPEGTPGKGSAIFLHCTGRNNYTAGCVAVAEDIMRELILDLCIGAKIVIFE